jgi:hypothetical protein
VDKLSERLGTDASALAASYRELLAQAQTLGYGDTFRLLGEASMLMLLLCALLKRNEPGGEGAGGAAL